ncbi:MAG: hypothetical protein JW816_02345 [Candidatus Buchananbacteria bacterium]|nr:hypothetical protein [Candidatus Buchananbacteria bacterium]
MSALFLGLWLSASEIMYLDLNFLPRIFIVDLTFLFGIWILHYFYIFTYYFPFQRVEIRWQEKFIYFLTILISVSIFIPSLYARSADLDFPFLFVNINKIGLSIFVAYFVLLIVLSLKNLLSKYFISDGIHKINLKKVIVGTTLALIVNLFFSMSIYFFTEFDTNVVGAFFTLGVIIYIYLILFPRDI